MQRWRRLRRWRKRPLKLKLIYTVLKFNRSYSSSFNLSNIGEFFLRLNTKGWIKLQKREGNRFPVFTSSTKRKNWAISGRGRASTEKKRTKKGDSRTKVLLAYLLLFCRFRCRRRPQRCLSSLYLVLVIYQKPLWILIALYVMPAAFKIQLNARFLFVTLGSSSLGRF